MIAFSERAERRRLHTQREPLLQRTLGRSGSTLSFYLKL